MAVQRGPLSTGGLPPFQARLQRGGGEAVRCLAKCSRASHARGRSGVQPSLEGLQRTRPPCRRACQCAFRCLSISCPACWWDSICLSRYPMPKLVNGVQISSGPSIPCPRMQLVEHQDCGKTSQPLGGGWLASSADTGISCGTPILQGHRLAAVRQRDRSPPGAAPTTTDCLRIVQHCWPARRQADEALPKRHRPRQQAIGAGGGT